MRVTLEAYIPRAAELTARIAWASISALPAPKLCPSRKEVKKLFTLARKMKLSSVLDFPYYIVTFEDVSRVFTHQWVRYRIAAHVQQSMRFVKVDVSLQPRRPWFVVPPRVVKAGLDAVLEYVKAQLRAAENYLYLLERGVAPEDARFVLPHSVKTHISSAMDAEELLHVIKQRTCTDAQWEIRAAAYALLACLYAVSPEIFSHAGPYCVWEGICRGRGKWACREEAERLLREVKKAGDKLREALASEEEWSYVEVDLTDVLGFRAPAELEEEVSRALGLQEPLNLSFEVRAAVRKMPGWGAENVLSETVGVKA